MKREKFIPETVIDEDVPAFMGALAQAAKDGKKEFEFGGKTFKVKLKKDVADKITKNMDESEDFDGLISDLVEASAADYAKLSDSDLIDLFAIFKNVGRDAAKPVVLAIKREMKKRSMKEDVELQEGSFDKLAKKLGRINPDTLEDVLKGKIKLSPAERKEFDAFMKGARKMFASESTDLEEVTLPFKELEKAWIRAKDNDKKKEKLIKRHDLKPLISNVRPGAIKLGPLNNLKMKTGNHTMAGLDADGELIFVTNNPLKIRYPSSGNIKDRPRGQEMKESVSLETLRLRKVIQLSVNESDEKLIDSFIAESDVDISWAPSKISKTFSQYLKEGAYPLYHRSFSDAAQAAIDLALRKGFEVDEDDWFDQVSTGPKKPGKGKTNRYIVKVTKNGKETRKRLAFQVYGMDSGKYELNAYVESTQIKESTDLEEIVGTVALGTVVAVGTLAAMFGAVKGAKYMANKLGDAAQSYVDKKDLAAVQAKRSKYQDKIDSITAKFDGDTKLQSMYKSLPEFSRSNTKAAVAKNADRTKKMAQIAKYIKSKLDAEELKAFADISKSLRSKNEEYGEVEEATDKELDIKSLKDLIKNPSPKMIKQYGGKDKYIKMLKSKLAKLESIEEATFYKPKVNRESETITFVNDAEAKQAEKLFTSMKLKVKRSGKRISFINTAEFKSAKSKVMAESVNLEEAVKWWTVTITKKAGKLFKGQTVDVKASNSAQAIEKGLKQMKADPVTVPSGSVDAVLGESRDIDFEKTNVLTYAEYDEVQNFQNFNKKDWKRNVIQRKYIRKKKV